jgi:S1-C subfamily serine protease
MPTTLEALSNDLAGAVERAGAAVVAIHARKRIPASGIVWRPGLVVAADHTVHKPEDVRVTLADGTEVRAAVAGRDPSTDLCILKLADGAGPAPAAVSREPLRVGQFALAVGRPGARVTASFGVVSALGGEWRTARGGKIDQFVRLDLAVYDGFSGGPLVNASGEVAGLCTSGLARGAAVAIPTATIDRVVDRLLAGGGATGRGYLGIGTQPVPLPDSVRDAVGPIGGRAPRVGLMVVAVQPGTPAERAGVLLGDLLVGLDDETTEDPRDILAALGAESIGKTLRATVVRAGQPTTLSITVGAHPSGS